jgi:hypothetical protein
MADQISPDRVVIISSSERKYDILQKQNCVIIKKLATPSVLPEYKKPRPISHTHKKVKEEKPSIIPSIPKVIEKKKKVEITTPNDVSLVSPISNSMSFAELQKKVDEMRAKEKEKKENIVKEVKEESNEEIPVVTIEDADDLANGVVSEEQELINKKYLKSLNFEVLKKVYYVATNKRWSEDISKYEMRVEILKMYKEANSKRKQVIYEASKEAV